MNDEDIKPPPPGYVIHESYGYKYASSIGMPRLIYDRYNEEWIELQ